MGTYLRTDEKSVWNWSCPRALGAGARPVFYSGFSTIEILIAFAVGITFLSAAMMVAFSDPTLTKQVSIDTGQASALDAILDNSGLHRATNKISDVTYSLASNWNAVLQTADILDSGYTYKAPAVMDISPCVKQITGALSWTSLNSRNRNISFGTALSNIDVATAFGRGGCDPLPPGEWNSPKKYPNGITLSSVTANDIIVTPDQGKRIAILGTTASTPTIDDLYLYDVSDPSNPSSILGSINTGKGINAIARHDEYIFALQNDSSNQLQIIRIFDTSKSITDPAYYTPTLIKQISLHNVSGAYPEGRSIAYYDGHIYIGTWNNNIPATSPEFLIYTVSNPTNPIFSGAYNLGHSINSIAIEDSYAYLATTDNVGELTIMNVSNPSSPVIEGKYDISGSSIDAEEVYTLGQKAYLGLNRRVGQPEFLILNVTTPANPSLLGGLNLNLKSNTKITGIDVHGPYAFVGTNVSTEEFRVLNITNPTHISILPCSPYNYSAKISDLQYADGYIFLANQTNDVIRVIYDTNGNTCN